jgi:hypothetical protein
VIGFVAVDMRQIVAVSFRAQTRKRRAWPTSLAPAVCCLPVAPMMHTQFPPASSQRSHW